MTTQSSIIELGGWLQTPPGRHLLAWEQRAVDAAVADAFGFHALQLGLPMLQALRANRMPHRWVALDQLELHAPMPEPVAMDDALRSQWPLDPVALHCDLDALPFPSNSLDLVVLPHALERSRDPHLTLREVERVLVPEGRLMILGFNPTSLWGMRQRSAHLKRGVGVGRDRPLFMPEDGEFINYWRLRDWLRLLSFEVEEANFGVYRPPLRSDAWLQRMAWMDNVGARWWPVLGAVYFVVAVKRVRGMRLVGLARREARATGRAGVAVTPKAGQGPINKEAS
jgi:SAM-dependent methyltransferase